MTRYKFLLNSNNAQILTEEGIVFLHGGHDLKPRLNKVYTFTNETIVAHKVGFQSGQALYNLGMYSYVNSPLREFDTVGNYCSIAPNVAIQIENFDKSRFTTSAVTYLDWYVMNKNSNIKMFPIPQEIKPISIGHDVWIGVFSSLKPGIHLGTGCVIESRSNVTEDVPPYAIVGGDPARIIKFRFPTDIIEELLKSNWFSYDISTMNIRGDISIPAFLNEFELAKVQGKVSKIKYTKFKEILDIHKISYEQIN